MIHETKYTNRNKPTKEDLRRHKRYHEFKSDNNFINRIVNMVIKEKD